MKIDVQEYLDEIDRVASELTVENCSTEEEQQRIQELIDEVEVVQNAICDYEEGKTKTLVIPEGKSELTTELSVADLVSVSYKKFKDQETSLLDRAYEYIKGLVNSIISYLKKALVKHHAENATYTKEIRNMDKELTDDVIHFNSVISDFMFKELFAFIDTKSLYFETNVIDYIESSEVDIAVGEFIKLYSNKQSVLRPPERVVENTMSDERNTPRDDMIQLWHRASNDLYINLANNTPVSGALHNKTDVLRQRGSLNERADLSLPVVPISSDGINISYLFLTENKDLLLGKVNITPKDTRDVSVSKLRSLFFKVGQTDLGEVVKKDIYNLERIEKDSKRYFKAAKSDLGSDAGKKKIHFNHMVTLINTILTICDNRIVLSKKLLALYKQL